MALHQCNAFERLDGADENGRGGSFWLADDVEHEMRAVVEEDIGVTGSKIHRADSRSRTAEVVARRIAGRIGFDFYNAGAKTARGEIVHDNLANQEAREFDGVLWKFRALQTTERECLAGVAHGENVYLLEARFEGAADRDALRWRSSGETRSCASGFRPI